VPVVCAGAYGGERGRFHCGLLSGERRKTGWMRAEAAGDPGPWRQQELLGRDRWDADALRDLVELSLKVGDGGNREGGISWGCLTSPLLHRRSDMPCPKITSSG
jgi:hypothetical protein